jgi:Zn-dependent oligopeptidase
MEQKKVMTKKQIVKALGRVRDNLNVIIASFEELDGDKKTERLATNRITFTLFEVVDELVDVEANIYNYLKRRQNGLRTKKAPKERT